LAAFAVQGIGFHPTSCWTIQPSRLWWAARSYSPGWALLHYFYSKTTICLQALFIHTTRLSLKISHPMLVTH